MEIETLFKFVQYLSECESSDSIEKALSKRLVFDFDNRIVMNISGSGRLTAFLKNGDGSFFQKGWKYDSNVETWEFEKAIDEANIGGIFDEFIEVLGTPQIHLPWREYFETLSETAEDDPEMIEDLELFELVQETLDEAGASFVNGSEFLPPRSDFTRFLGLVNQLETENWLIVWDECCWTCAKSNIESQQSLDDPYFIIYGQNADDFFTPEGELRGIMFKPHTRGKNREVELARENGFGVRIDSDGLVALS